MNLYGYPSDQIFSDSNIINYTLYYNLHASFITFTAPLSDWAATGFFSVIFFVVLLVLTIIQKNKRNLTLFMLIISFIVYLIWLIMGIIILYNHIRMSGNIFVLMGYFMIGILAVLYYLNLKSRNSKGEQEISKQ